MAAMDKHNSSLIKRVATGGEVIRRIKQYSLPFMPKTNDEGYQLHPHCVTRGTTTEKKGGEVCKVGNRIIMLIQCAKKTKKRGKTAKKGKDVKGPVMAGNGRL